MGQKVIGCDVGGTFTDLICVDQKGGGIRLAKVPTTIENRALGVLHAIAEAGESPANVDLLVHGTTAATNALLERKIARCGLLTTKGFRDVLELGRRTRPHAYGMIGSFEPLISREHRLEVTERMDAAGQVLVPLDEDGVRVAVRHLKAAGVESLVIHFLHSYINPAHEERTAAIVAEMWPEVYLTVGHRLTSEFREYERGVTASLNAAVQPVLQRYLGHLQEGLAEQGYGRDFLFMQGNGGTVSSRSVIGSAVQTVMSGPASGVIAAAYISTAAGFSNVITYDMGGTSTDVALIEDGRPMISSERELEYAMPIRLPMVDVHSVGAGGGSIASVDAAGMLRVGPRSAGAAPGPICFGRGGRLVTITDANLILGRLSQQRLTGVGRHVPIEQIRDIIGERIGRPLGLDAEGAAAAILRVADDKMAGAVRIVSVGRGRDPRDFTFFAFGGAGPLHATTIARELGIPKVLIPARPGMTNALGCVVADLRRDFVRSVNTPLDELGDGIVAEILEDCASRGRELIRAEKADIDRIDDVFTAGIQFKGQTHELDVPVTSPKVTAEELRVAFDDAYWRRFRMRMPEARAILVKLHTAVIGRRTRLDLKVFANSADDRGRETAPATRKVWVDSGWHETAIYHRDWLSPGIRFVGPAIVEQLDATVVIEPGQKVGVDAFGNLIIDVRGS